VRNMKPTTIDGFNAHESRTKMSWWEKTMQLRK
jgi:hypothetical protein